MAGKLPEMLLRWNVFEDLLNEILTPIQQQMDRGMCIDPTMWENAVREIDQAAAAATHRGDKLCPDLCGNQATDEETMNKVWDRFQEIAKRKYPNDKRLHV